MTMLFQTALVPEPPGVRTGWVPPSCRASLRIWLSVVGLMRITSAIVVMK
jgi:hypothetical protein